MQFGECVGKVFRRLFQCSHRIVNVRARLGKRLFCRFGGVNDRRDRIAAL